MNRIAVKKLISGIMLSSLYAFTLAGEVWAVPQPHAMPLGPEVIYGDVSISQVNPTSMQINNSPNAIINWQSFSLNNGELTQFIQQSAQSAVLNRVIGQDPSSILGSIQSNGRVFLVNPNGVVFGSDAVIDTAGLVVSSLAISNNDFVNGRFNFQAQDGGEIVNNGYIRSGKNGEIVFIAPQVKNNGIIEAEDGNILLAAGRSINLSSLDAEGISIELTAPGDQVLNLGKLIADKGVVGLFADVISHSGISQANALVKDAQGRIQLVAQSKIELGPESQILAQSGDVLIKSDGQVDVSGGVNVDGINNNSAGQIKILGAELNLSNTQISSSANDGGGEILIGGDFQGQGQIPTATNTYIDKYSTIKADALIAGDGGRIIVWADNLTEMHGTISAIGGANNGNGGFAEVSGKKELKITGMVDLDAEAGDAGQLLLDPEFVSIVSNDDAATGTNTISVDWIEQALKLSSVNIQTGSRGIIVDMPISFDSGNQLLFKSGSNIDVRNSIVGSNSANSNLSAGISLSAAGNIVNTSARPVIISANTVHIVSEKNLALGESLSIQATDLVKITAANSVGLSGNISAPNISLNSNNGVIIQASTATLNTSNSLEINATGDVDLGGAGNNFNAISVNTSKASEGGNVHIIHDENTEIVSFGITTPVGVNVNIEPYTKPVDSGNGSGITDTGITDTGIGFPTDTGSSSTSSGSSSSENQSLALGADSDPVSLLLASAEITKYKSDLDTEKDNDYKDKKRKRSKKSTAPPILHCSNIHQ